MAFTNQTTHYGLPLPIGSDKSTWLDTNTAFAAIDAAIYQASTDAASAAGDITTIQGDISSLQSGKQNVLTFDGSPTLGSTNPVTSGGVYNADNAIKIDLAATDLKVSALEAAVGTTDISGIGDGTITGAISTLAGGAGVSVNFTSTDTHAAALATLLAAIDLTKLTAKSVIHYETSAGENKMLRFTRSDAAGNRLFEVISLSSGTAFGGDTILLNPLAPSPVWYSDVITGGSVTNSDISNSTMGQNGTLSMYY